jgi:hypothetical protein
MNACLELANATMREKERRAEAGRLARLADVARRMGDCCCPSVAERLARAARITSAC